MISAVLVSFNERIKLERCLKNLQNFADEIVVMDLGSSDSSSIVCKKYNAKIFKHDFVPFVEIVRNDAIAKASGEWILVLDPDEVVSDVLKVKLKQVILEDKYQAVNIPRKNIFFGKWIAHTNWWPDKHIRFFKKGYISWSNKIHKYPEVSGKILDMEAQADLAVIHYSYDSVKEFMDRQNRYSSAEAKNLHNNGIRFSFLLFLWKPMREFLARFIRHAGFLDGFYGFGLTILMMIYQMEVMVKLWELEREK
ncbi:hypothetical protein A3I48_02095 [Candidatus Daviesbacteria bacterium RIFCSPLOWO2_02_FULL_36_7]|uniref:Glycosyltransferase 2-like domain-containing protein n=1 Tax=Candidatus Daviesbacteria bacterium RIFCSPLOWO2_02_FULL_36_7 TaxID=1797792 RepID=A0A1F5MI32_9BACT|nr:MAG: hypothetical protein A3I48_02095 [Candidatus Daviesbacteria bacterium RIFCSPLOWO2_02_FULL_36_7]